MHSRWSPPAIRLARQGEPANFKNYGYRAAGRAHSGRLASRRLSLATSPYCAKRFQPGLLPVDSREKRCGGNPVDWRRREYQCAAHLTSCAAIVQRLRHRLYQPSACCKSSSTIAPSTSASRTTSPMTMMLGLPRSLSCKSAGRRANVVSKPACTDNVAD